jgi:hypothetical protein
MSRLLKSAIKKSFNLAGLELSRRVEKLDVGHLDGNFVIPRVWERPVFKSLIASRIEPDGMVALLGSREEIEFLSAEIERQGHQVLPVLWNWEGPAEKNIPEGAIIVLCKVPLNEYQWRTVGKFQDRYGSRVLGIEELVLPFTAIQYGQAALTYNISNLEELVSYYQGKKFFGPIAELNALYPLAGKRVIEFGPMEGAQTAGLLHFGAASVTCVEARAVSLIKTMIAKYCFNWDNVSLVMDDFHNARQAKYGTFDLAFAHGVYYHSIVPFYFFENLMSLSANIFIGGYCVENLESNPQHEVLEYEGKKYHVARIKIGNTYNSAINEFAYHFRKDDLVEFFSERNYKTTVISDDLLEGDHGDRYLRFLAQRQ